MEKHRKHHKTNALPVNGGLSPIAHFKAKAQPSCHNKIWTVLAFLFLYLSLVILGPLYFRGSIFINYPCMLCVETDEYLNFKGINHFMRGFFSLSVALIIYARWTRIIAVIVIVAILYSPLNDLHVFIRTGQYHAAYAIFPFVFNAFSEPYETWWLYSNNEMLQMLLGTATALIGYALIYKYNNNNPRVGVPLFALFVVGVSGVCIYLLEQTFRVITIQTYILFTVANIMGLRFLWAEYFTVNKGK